jgi:hypothetical protein
MSRVSLLDFELANLVRTPGGLRTRKGLVSVKTPTASTSFVGGFTVESANTSEPWHYLFEQGSDGTCTLRVYTEEFFQVFSYALGQVGRDPVITWAVDDGKLFIGSPSFPHTIYGVVGGGLMPALKVASENLDTTSLDIPPGHVASFGGRFIVTDGSRLMVNEPRRDDDPRAFVDINVIGLGGAIYDLFQGGDGALQIFTSAGLYSIPVDAVGQGQDVRGFVSKVSGIETSKPRNAATSGGVTAVLQRDSIQILGGESMRLPGIGGRRTYAQSVDVGDLRSGSIFPVRGGFVVGFRGSRSVFLNVDLVSGSLSWTTSVAASFPVVGTLKSREGDTLLVLSDRVVASMGPVDGTATLVVGCARGRLATPFDGRAVVRRVSVPASNVNAYTYVSVNGETSAKKTGTRSGEVIVGSSTWGASVPLVGRSPRHMRHSFAVRAHDTTLEVVTDGGDREAAAEVEVELAGQGVKRPWKGAT